MAPRAQRRADPDTVRLAMFTAFLAQWTGRHEWHTRVAERDEGRSVRRSTVIDAGEALQREALLDNASAFIVYAHGIKTSRAALQRGQPEPARCCPSRPLRVCSIRHDSNDSWPPTWPDRSSSWQVGHPGTIDSRGSSAPTSSARCGQALASHIHCKNCQEFVKVRAASCRKNGMSRIQRVAADCLRFGHLAQHPEPCPRPTFAAPAIRQRRDTCRGQAGDFLAGIAAKVGVVITSLADRQQPDDEERDPAGRQIDRAAGRYPADAGVDCRFAERRIAGPHRQIRRLPLGSIANLLQGDAGGPAGRQQADGEEPHLAQANNWRCPPMPSRLPATAAATPLAMRRPH